MPDARLDCEALYTDLDRERRRRHVRSQREVMRQAGIPGTSCLTRLGQGGAPDANNLIRLLLWLGTTDLAPYITTTED